MDGGDFSFGRRFSLVRLEAGIFPVRHGCFKCFALFIHARQHGALEQFQAPFAGVPGQLRAFDLAGSSLGVGAVAGRAVFLVQRFAVKARRGGPRGLLRRAHTRQPS